MCPTPTVTIHALPPEVVFYICRLAITFNLEHWPFGASIATWDSNESIAHLQLVCRAWRDPALRATLHSVSLFDLASTRSLLDTLAINPVRATFVKYLAIGVDDGAQDADPDEISAKLLHESLEMVSTICATSALVHLHIHPLHFGARESLLPAVRQSRALQTLVISPRFRSWAGETWGVDAYSRTDVVELALPPFLRRLELDFASSWSAPIPVLHPQARPNLINTLWLNCDSEENALWQVLSQSESLEILQLYFERLLPKEGPTEEDLAEYDATETPIFDLLLPRYRRLESLSVTATELSCHLFRLLPRSLRSLEVTSLNDRARFFMDLQLLDDLEDPNLEVTLEELTVRDQAQVYDPDLIQQFYERCVARGIVFTFQPDSPDDTP
ncbi:hypothetical protein JCM11491_005717 [Sporobolomyces phaffii]